MMFLVPKSVKFTKNHVRSKTLKKFKKITTYALGDVFLTTAESGFVSSKQLESVRTLLRRKLKKQAKILFKLTPDTPLTKKPSETRMGKGKGDVSYWVSTVHPGQKILEIKGYKLNSAKQALVAIKKKFRMKTFITLKSLRWTL